ncbi:septation protein SepH, partial [Kribbella jejuensis]
MREARLVGLSQDGTQLILAVAETGEEFAVPVDDRLRAALRGDRARLGQLEIQMESALRPRDIQARIRAGESPEAVAAVAQMPMERVMAFAGPVLAERDHIASLAQRASVRRRGGGDAPTRNLGAWVTDRLRLRQVDPASADWDAWRREDGRWAVRVSYFVESEDNDDPAAEKKDEKVAMFAYDAPGRYAVPDDDEARWLVGEQAQVLPTPVQPQPGERRLAAVADIDPLIAPDHGADSYEAGFEDTIALRRRNHPVSDAPRRDAERGPRRVHSVPNPDEEPTLIDVPVDQPPAPRPSVRAVERPTFPTDDYPEDHTA